MTAAGLAAWLDAYRTDLRGSLERASEQGFRLVQPNAASAALDPRDFGPSARRHFRKFLNDLGLDIDGFALEFGGAGLADPAHAGERLERLKATMELAADLKSPRATVSLSGFNDPATGPLARELLASVADWADRIGVDTAIRNPVGMSDADIEHIRKLSCPRLRVALDTATDAVGPRTLEVAGDLLASVYLRDVRQVGGKFEEVPFGRGEVDFSAVLATLAGARPATACVIRHDGPGGVDALRQGREYIGSLLGRVGLR